MVNLGDQLNEWVRSLRQLQQLVVDDAENTTMILQQTDAMQPQFQAIIEAIEAADLSSAVEQTLRPYQTEAHRRLRLIKVEGMRLRTARAPETIAQVRSQLRAHIEQLQQFAITMANAV